MHSLLKVPPCPLNQAVVKSLTGPLQYLDCFLTAVFGNVTQFQPDFSYWTDGLMLKVVEKQAQLISPPPLCLIVGMTVMADPSCLVSTKHVVVHCGQISTYCRRLPRRKCSRFCHLLRCNFGNLTCAAIFVFERRTEVFS